MLKRRCLSGLAAAVLLLAVFALAACTAGALGRAAQSGPAASPPAQATAAHDLPLPAGTASRLPRGVFYLTAGPNAFQESVWEVTAQGGQRRIGPVPGRGSGVRLFGASRAGIVVSAAMSGIDYIGRLTRRSVYWLPHGRISVHGFDPGIADDGGVTYVTPPGGSLRQWAVWVQRSFRTRPAVRYKQSAPLGSPVLGPGRRVATFTSPYTPRPGKIQSVIIISPNGHIRRVRTGYQELNSLLWQANAPALEVLAPGCRSELLSTATGRTQQLPRRWCPYAWSPDGRKLLMLAVNGTALGVWSQQHPDKVVTIGPVNKHLQIGQVSWLARKASIKNSGP
jgi:hypothetical protein